MNKNLLCVTTAIIIALAAMVSIPLFSSCGDDRPVDGVWLTNAPVVTTQYLVITTGPVVTTQKPVITTTPVVTTQEPVITTAPVVTTQEPVITTAPVVTTQEPVITTAPVVTTQKPVITTAPVVTTQKPVITTAPVVTTQKPVITTAPVVTTQKPVITTAPVVTTQKPVITTAPVVTTQAPVITTAPVVTTRTPVVYTTPEEQFRKDNFAAGRLTDSLLDSVNPGVLALLSCCMYYEDQLQQGIKRGEKWVYSNSSTYVPQSVTFDKMVQSGKPGSNCALPQGWALIDMGVNPTTKHMYGNSSGEIANLSTIGKYIGAVATITSWKGEFKFKDLYSSAKIKPGDIFFCKGHTFIYLGDEKFMAAGHDGKWHTDSTAKTEDSKKAVFETWIRDMKSNSDYSYAIYYQVRFKDEFVPEYYRDSAGRLVPVPIYNAETSIEYKSGVSPEKATIINGKESDQAYDDSGKTNVLYGKTFSKEAGFNLEHIDYADRMTDGQLFYDNTTSTFTDIKIPGGHAYVSAPGYWFDANGEKSAVKDGTHKYICGFYTDIGETKTLDSFLLCTQGVGATSGAPFCDIDGFDILISADGLNWTVAYSASDMTKDDKWSYPTGNVNKSQNGYYMTHMFRADFVSAVEGRYVMFALTEGRNLTGGTAQGTTFGGSTTSHYFRIAEMQVYVKQQSPVTEGIS